MTGEILLKTPGISEVLGGEPSNFMGTICTDTRRLSSGQAYMALNGENFRGFKFSKQALEKGASIIITECLPEEREDLKHLQQSFPQSTFVIVENATKYFQDLSNVWAKEWREEKKDRFLIGLTGSNGKTTTKEILRQLLNRLKPGQVYATEGNLNNQFGVPMTLLNLNSDIEVGVIEMGTSLKGEIEILAKIVEPEAGLITNVGPAHLEALDDLDGVYKEKSSLYKVYSRGKDKKGFVVDGDDPYLSQLSGLSGVDDLIAMKSTLEKPTDNYEYRSDGALEINFSGTTHKIMNPNLSGKHNWKNLALALQLLVKIYPSKEGELVKGASQTKLPEMNRGSWHEKNGIKIYMDAYNANPASMKASFEDFLESLKKASKTPNDLLLVVGDMNELGEGSSRFHTETAKWMSDYLEKNLPEARVQAVFVGHHAVDYQRGWSKSSELFENVQEAKKSFPFSKGNWSGVFLKGSRSLQLESVVDIFDGHLSN